MTLEADFPFAGIDYSAKARREGGRHQAQLEDDIPCALKLLLSHQTHVGFRCQRAENEGAKYEDRHENVMVTFHDSPPV
ncbi:MAG: hypothetical protein JSW35_06390 [Deltaproteobacteria bacterium]|nr:MAG: hypothetical protein JSW35_06390 [Deltaproteobacteria bacterium]